MIYQLLFAVLTLSLLQCGGSISELNPPANPVNNNSGGNNSNPANPANSGGNPPNPADIRPPETQILSGPANSTTSLVSVFTFSSSEAGTFQCRVNGGTYTDCLSPHTVLGLQPGSHRFEVRAVDAAGNLDATAAVWQWTITTVPVNTVAVRTVQELIAAVEDTATPGTEIVLEDGTYDLNGRPIVVDRAGQANNRIVVRPRNPGSVTIENDGATQAFQITEPYWTFENLNFTVAGNSARHAYKLDTNGHDTIIRGGRMALAPTAESGVKGSGDPAVVPQPDNVLVEGTEIYFTSPSTNGVAEGIDAVGVRNWTVRGNTIHGIIRSGATVSAQIAFAIVLKGNSQDSVIENNLLYDNFISISVGGTTGTQFFRDGDTTFEHRGGIVRNNVMHNNTDVAIYLENATGARVYNNTAYNSYSSGGNSAIDHRLNGRPNPASYTADFRNNLLDKSINNRGATLTQSNNLIYSGLTGYAINQFVNAAGRDLRVVSSTPVNALFTAVRDQGATLAEVASDFSGTARPQGSAYDIGAYEQFGSAGGGSGGGGGTAGDISLQRETAHGIPGFYYGQIGVADFNGDGLPDLAVIGSWGPAVSGGNQTCVTRIRLYRNTSTAGGPIQFVQQNSAQGNVEQASGCRAATLAIGDFNGDGRRDIGYQFHEGTYAGAYLNNGSWSFTQAIIPGNLWVQNSSLGMAAADVDRDGRDELIFISNESQSAPYNNGALWYRYSPAGNTWLPQQMNFFHYISYGGALAAGDLNGDSYPEIAVGGNSNRRFGSQDCSVNLQYGHVFRNFGASNPGFDAGNPQVPDRRDYNNEVQGFPVLPTAGSDILSAFFALRADMNDSTPCHGSDNASYHIADMDGDGSNDIVVAGSAPGFGLPETDLPAGAGCEDPLNVHPNCGRRHYSLSVMFNGGTGASYQVWQNTGIDLGARNGNTTNSGVGNVEVPNIAVGDLNGDGQPEIFIQGHRRNAERRQGPNDGGAPNDGYYIFQSMLLQNNGNRSFTELNFNLPHVGEGGQAIADFNNDGRPDLIFGGALIPWHSNGNNGTDTNTLSTIITEVYRNESVP